MHIFNDALDWYKSISKENKQTKCKCKKPNHWIKTGNDINLDYCRICNIPL